MVLKCNECGAGFSFDENLLKETGSKVRCSKCKSVFTAYPPSSAGEPETSNDDGVELKNIDLAEIEGILGMDGDAGSPATKESGELDFDITTDEDKGEAALESTLEVEETEELDPSNMDNILKEDGSPEGTLSLDLSDMENILKEEGESSIEEDSGLESGLDFDAALEVEKTEELDLSDMDNILEADDEPTLVSESSDEENFDLELDFGSDDKEVVSDSEPVLETEETEDLDLSDFENILEEDKEPEAEGASTDEPAGLDLDFDIDESPDEDGSDFELEETVNLDLSDMENILKAEDEPTLVGESSDEEDFDLGLDFGSDDKEVVDDSEPVVETEETEDLDLSDFENILEEDKEPEAESVSTDEPTGLDLDFDIDDSPDEDGSDLELEETAELDLSDMDNALEIEDKESKSVESVADEDPGFTLDLDLDDDKGQDDKIAPSAVAEAEASDDLDFDLDLDMDEDEGADSAESEIGPELELEEIEELGLSDMEDGTSVTKDTPDEEADELDFALDLGDVDDGTDDGSLAVELGDAEEFDLSDLDSVLDEEDKQAKTDISVEKPEEIELDIEDDMVIDSDDKASEIQLEATEKFDLSDIDQMIDTDETAKSQDIKPDEVELDFEIDGDAQDSLTADETSEKQTVLETEEKLDDTFDMGALQDESEATDADIVADSRKPKADIHKKKPAGKKLSKPMRILLILILLIGGAYGAKEILDNMGIKISVKDAIGEIPFVGDLIKPDVKDVGNLYVNINERAVNGKFIDNSKIGTLFVVTGQIKNEYQHSRRFIRMTGKIFKKGRTLVKSETVYCGNILSETELKSLDKVLMTKRLKNRFGDKRTNMNVNKGQLLPFMIVFSNIPKDLEEYSVQVAGSEKS